MDDAGPALDGALPADASPADGGAIGDDAGLDFVPGQPLSAPNETWTWIPFPDSRCGDGSTTGIGVNLTARSDVLIIYVRGGGACWDQRSCYVDRLAMFLVSGSAPAEGGAGGPGGGAGAVVRDAEVRARGACAVPEAWAKLLAFRGGTSVRPSRPKARQLQREGRAEGEAHAAVNGAALVAWPRNTLRMLPRDRLNRGRGRVGHGPGGDLGRPPLGDCFDDEGRVAPNPCGSSPRTSSAEGVDPRRIGPLLPPRGRWSGVVRRSHP